MDERQRRIPKGINKIPATIVTGFLGSGKTTLLRHVLDNANGRRIAVIVNEFGELGIDGELLGGCGIGCDESDAERPGDVYELANGCLCCTVQEEFYPVMRKLIERRDEIDHILIETSGLALPKPLVQAFNWPEVRNACTVDAVVTVVDVPAAAAGQFAHDPQAVEAQRAADPNLDHESALHELFEDQLSSADLVVLSKSDLVSPAALEQVEQSIRQDLPNQVKVIACEQGRVPVDLVLGMQRGSEDTIDERHSHHDHGDEPHDHDHDLFDSVVVRLPELDRERLMQALETLVRKHTVFRVKGFVAVPGKPMRLLVHGVGRRFASHFDRRWREGEARHTQLVLIGQHLNAEELELALAVAAVSPETV